MYIIDLMNIQQQKSEENYQILLFIVSTKTFQLVQDGFEHFYDKVPHSFTLSYYSKKIQVIDYRYELCKLFCYLQVCYYI